MLISGKKVVLRAIERDDLYVLKDAINSHELESYECKTYFPVSEINQLKWIESLDQNDRECRLIIEYDGKAVGYTNIMNIDWVNRIAWTGIKLFSSEVRGKGLGTDSVMAVMRYAFESLNLNRLEGAISEFNEASYNLYVGKCGWQVEGIKRSGVYKNGRYYDVRMVSILKDEYYSLIEDNKYWEL